MGLVSSDTRVLIQGITGREGRLHTKEMMAYGTKVVAGVTPGKGGEKVHGIPVYNSVEDALDEHHIDASVVLVPARYAPDAVYEAIDGGIKLIIVVTEHIPVHETLRMVTYAKYKGSMIIGPNTPGIIVPGETKLGIMPSRYFKRGTVSIISRSGTLTYEVAGLLSNSGLGIATAIGIGGDPIVGTDFSDIICLLERDERSKSIVIIGEIGGDMEERLAERVSKNPLSKKVVAFIAGKEAPPGKKMGHAGALIMGERGSAWNKIEALKEAGVPVAVTMFDIPKLLES
ncbi:MAG TPA: succinate--CoA ligase subunit alpha [Thermofilum sp.]|nr:succinate--CoA ligase subunit alpha [Thermofilum sp.]